MERKPFKDLKRMTWEESLMAVATQYALRSVCRFYKVGAVIVGPEYRILAAGYNGPVKGDLHCSEIGCAKWEESSVFGRKICRGAHAEANAIVNAACQGVSIKDSILIVTVCPCWDCAKLIVNAGIKRVIYLWEYDRKDEDFVERWLLDRGVAISKLEVKTELGKKYFQWIKSLLERR